MKKILVILFLFQFIILAAYEAKDYESFIQGIENFDKKEYKKSESIFQNIIDNHSNSKLIKSTYLYYYLGKTYYEQQNYSKAIEFLEKSHYFPEESLIIIAQCYDKLNDKQNQIKTLIKLYKSEYDYSTLNYEKQALETLGKINSKFEIILDLRFNNNLKNLENLEYEDLIINGNYFFSKGNYSLAEKLYFTAINKQKDDYIEVKILQCLFYQKNHTQVINNGLKFIKTNKYKSKIYFHIANSYRRLGKIDESISYFKKVKALSLQDESNFLIGRLYYIKKDYKLALEYLQNSNYYSSEEYIIKCYEKLGDEKKVKSILLKGIKSSPYSTKAAEYRYKMYQLEKNPDYLTWIVKYNFNTLYYDFASEITNKTKSFSSYDLENKMKNYDDFFKKIEYLMTFADHELAKIEFEYTLFSNEDSVFNAYLKTRFYEIEKDYYQATRNSWLYNYSFSKYKNLAILLYPEYYKSSVEKYAKEYNVNKNFIYSIIKQESLFKQDEISTASAYGLMQIVIPTAKMFDTNITPEQLLDPDINIKIGTQYLKYLLDRFDGNEKLAAAAYNAGPGNVDKWMKNNTLEIENIPYTETKNYVKKVLSNYNKYKYFYTN